MTTKHKRTKRNAAGLLQQAQRLLEKGDFKQALKDAKVCCRQQPGPEARQVLERAYLGRGRQLYRAGLRAESQAVMESLLELGVTDSSVRQELPELLLALGLFDRISGCGGDRVLPENDSRLLSMAADHAVVQPQRAPASLPGIRPAAEAIRRALAAVEAGREADAIAALKDIPHASPLADWKYFVRGLAAYYRQETEEMRANWERLDPQRFAARIAAALQALADRAGIPADDCRIAERVARLDNAVLDGPVLARLHKLQTLVAEGRWLEAVKMLRAEGPLFRQVDSTLPQRIAMVLYATFVHKGAPAALRELATVAEPPPIDPRWNRGLALAWEWADADVTEAEDYWRAYLDDLGSLECLLPGEHMLARALVWLRLGRLLVDESCPICPTCGVRHDPDEEAQTRAVACFENSLNLAPDLLSGYQALATALEEWEEPERAAGTYRRLVERFPDNLEALLFLAQHYVKRDEPFAARDFVFRAQRLKPLDPKIKALVWTVHVASARHHALAGRWDEGRAEFAAAEACGGPQAQSHHLLVRRAALEFKAGEFGLAQRLLDRARRELGESAPVWLLITIESLRYALPKAVARDFEYRWLAAMKKSPRSAAIGEMCRIVVAHLAADVSYPGREEHVGHLLDLLRRCSRVKKWQACDLRSVLEFLLFWEHHEEEREEEPPGHSTSRGLAALLADFAAKARAKFPENAFFQFVAGELEMRRGPWKCDRQFAYECFQRVVQLAAGANDPDTAALAKRAKEKIHLLDEVEQLPLGAAPPSASADEEYDEAGDPLDLDEDEDEEEEDDGWENPSSADSPGKLFAMFARFCRSVGVDPKDFLDQAAEETPFRFRAKPGAKATRKKRK